MPQSQQTSSADVQTDAHTSAVMRKLIKEVPQDHFTLAWLIGHLPNRSFGIILLILALISLLPVISFLSRFLIMLLTAQAILGYAGPVLPRRLAHRRISSAYLIRMERHIIPFLEYLEMYVRPRWPICLHGTRRVAALMVWLLTLISLLAPIPFANIPTSIICVFMALAYIEHDGLFLTGAFAVAVILLAGGITLLVQV